MSTSARDLKTAVGSALAWCWGNRVEVPLALAARALALGAKTEGYFGDVIDRLVAQLYNGNMDELEFVQVLGDLIEGQVRDAWAEGALSTGITDMDTRADLQAQLASIVSDERQFVLRFADDIRAAEGYDHLNGTNSLPGLLSRGELWAQRYVDARNQAVLATARDDAHVGWELGATEDHCDECAALDGQVLTAAAWRASGYHPQDPPNALLGCGGWRCDCRLTVTDLPLTGSAVPAELKHVAGPFKGWK